jgi:TPR repeat protein
MTLYATMKEHDQAISAARDFQQALHNSEQCMTTLGRVYLAKNDHAEALKWFDQAIARNEALAEAHYFRGVARLTATPPDYAQAAASARSARKFGYPGAEELVREAESRVRGPDPT